MVKPVEILIKAKEEASGVFTSLQSKVAAVGVAIAGYFGIKAFTGAVQGAADLESAMSRVEAATNASAGELAALRQAAEDAGASTKFSSTQAANALEELGKAGLSAKDAIGALPAVLNLAQAGNIDLGRASEVVTAAVMGMGLQFSDAGRVADVLAMGANATKTSVEGLAQALSYAAPVANSLGLSLETTTAIIGQFAQGGIDASRAGTALNSILSQFGDPASKFREELGAAGIITNDFEKALRELAAAGPRGSKAINAVGQEAGPALRAMLNQGMGALDDLKVKLDGAAGSAAATGATMQNNLNGALSGLGSAWDTLKIKLATPVLPVLKDGVEKLSNAFRTAVSDGTVGKFGDAIATAFSSAIKWAKDFVGAIDFNQVAADLRAFAHRSGEALKEVGEHATAAGAAAKTAYGVMSGGANAILMVIYKMGEAFASFVSATQTGSALVLEGLSKITFGDLSRRFAQAASDMRLSAEATLAAGGALGEKSAEAFNRMAVGAQIARDGFAAVSKAATDTKPAADASSQAIANMAAQIEAAGQKSAEAAKATQAAKQAVDDKKAADIAATTAIQQLRAEYTQLVAGGSLQAAAEKLQQIANQNKKVAESAEDAAARTDQAYKDLGMTTTKELDDLANKSKLAWERIKTDSTASANVSREAFEAMAKAAVAAAERHGDAAVAATKRTLEAEAAVKGLTVEFDAAGKVIVKSMTDGSNAVDGTTKAVGRTTEQLKAQVDAWDTLMMKYKLSADYNENQIALLERQNALIEKQTALENKRLGRDSEGYALDTGGKRVSADVITERSVYEQAKSAGLTDVQALKITNRFVVNGEVKTPDRANAEKGETSYTLIAKAINELVMSNAKNAAAIAAQKEKTAASGATEADAQKRLSGAEERPKTDQPKASSTSPSSTPTASTSHTVTVNLGGQSVTASTKTANEAVMLKSILQQLTDAAGRS